MGPSLNVLEPRKTYDLFIIKIRAESVAAGKAVSRSIIGRDFFFILIAPGNNIWRHPSEASCKEANRA